MVVVIWFWRDGFLEVDRCDDVESAVGQIWYGHEYGMMSAISVEVDGESIDWRQHPHYLELEAQYKARVEASKTAPKPIARLQLKTPEATSLDRWETIGWFYDGDNYEADAKPVLDAYGKRARLVKT